MRRAILVFSLAALLTACDQPADAPASSQPPASAPAPEMPADAPPQEEVDATAATTPANVDAESCILDQGSDAAMRLVARCMAVSPASHPPCNPNNPCKLIQDEIDRSCELIPAGEARPAECSA